MLGRKHGSAAGRADHGHDPRRRCSTPSIRSKRQYRPYLVQLPAAPTASKEAAAAAAAGTVLAGVDPQTQAEMKAALAAYLARNSRQPRQGGRASSSARRSPRRCWRRAPMTDRGGAGHLSAAARRAGVYVPTAPTWAPQWPGVKPFAMTSGSQFRPAAPIALDERGVGRRLQRDQGRSAASTARSAPRSRPRTARFWLDGRRQRLLPDRSARSRRRRS